MTLVELEQSLKYARVAGADDNTDVIIRGFTKFKEVKLVYSTHDVSVLAPETRGKRKISIDCKLTG